MQANFLGAFSFGYTVIYSVASSIFDREQLPGVPYFFTLGLIYAVFWAPFYFQNLIGLPGIVAKFLGKLGDLLARTSVPTPIAVPPKDQGTLFAPKQAERPAESRWPLRESIMVQGLALTVIVMTAWYCTYSGGPFQSPYGQILLALPLLSPNIAAKSKSILSVYAVSVISALVFQFVFTSSDSMPTKTWYVGTTVGVLAISAYVSWVTRRRQEESITALLTSDKESEDDPDDEDAA